MQYSITRIILTSNQSILASWFTVAVLNPLIRSTGEKQVDKYTYLVILNVNLEGNTFNYNFLTYQQ